MSKWREIRCDFFNEEEERYYVDAWKTGNDNEEGKQVPENPYGMIEEFGYVANVIGSQDSLTTEDLEEAIIDAEFDYYDL